MQALLPEGHELKEQKGTKRKLATNPASSWASAWTLDRLKEYCGRVGVSTDGKKIDMVNALMAAGEVRPKSSRLKNLVGKIKISLGEPRELVATSSPIENTRCIGDLCLSSNDIVIGKVKDGVLVKLEESDVEYSLGQRLSLDKFCIKRERVRETLEIDLEEEEDCDEGSGDEVEEDV